MKTKESLVDIEKAYKQFPYNLKLKFKYGKALASNKRNDEARKILLELLGTSSDTYARLELGRLELSCRNYDLAREYFNSLINLASLLIPSAISSFLIA